LKPLLILALAVVLGCGSDGTTLEQSCAGETVPNCLPYEYAEIVSAEVTPERLPLDALGEELSIRVVFDKCDAAPRAHSVPLVVRVGGDDEGAGASLVTLLQLRDDGETDGDAVAGDGIIDVSVPNPFFDSTGVPANTDVFLRFQTRMPPDCSSGTCIGGTCQSEVLEIPYRTGPSSS
tara:strand:- start:576 stop:1109 length:534 start_codon:yes stop_codon:yes gene_type:complete